MIAESESTMPMSGFAEHVKLMLASKMTSFGFMIDVVCVV